MTRLTGKTSLVTGASYGVGRASALALANAGAQVLVHCNSGGQEADEVVAEIRAVGGRSEKVAVDLRTPDGPYRLAKRTFSIIGARLDILVTSAHVSKNTSAEVTTVEDFDDQFVVHVRAPYFLVQYLMPTMYEGSNVIFASPAPARVSTGAMSPCAATRGAIGALVKHFSTTLGARGARVNAIAPGLVGSELLILEERRISRPATPCLQALRRVARPEEVGAAVVFLASDEARWITGKTLSVGRRSEFSIE